MSELERVCMEEGSSVLLSKVEQISLIHGIGQDLIYEITLYLDAISITKLLSICKHLWSLRDNSNFSSRISPYCNVIKWKNPNKGFSIAIKNRNFAMIHYFINQGADYSSKKSLEQAIRHGCLDYVQQFFDFKQNSRLQESKILVACELMDWKEIEHLMTDSDALSLIKYALQGAARGGHKNVLEYLLNKVPNFYSEYLNCAMTDAIEWGHYDVVYFLVDKGAHELVAALNCSLMSGNTELTEFFIKRQYLVCPLSDLPDIRKEVHFNAAIRSTNKNMLSILESHGVLYEFSQQEWTLALYYHAKKGNKEMVEWCIEHGAQEWNEAATRASSGNHLELIKFFIQKGATKLEGAFCEAVLKCNSEVVDFTEAQGIDWNEALKMSVQRYRSAFLVLYCLKKGGRVASHDERWHQELEEEASKGDKALRDLINSRFFKC